jgi:hypothetical protein
VSAASARDAWLAAIGANGWSKATLEDAARLSGLSADAVAAACGDRFDAVAALQDHVATEAAMGAAEAGGSVRDRLFDGFMRGFDALQPQRAAVLAIRSSRDPGVAMLLAGRAGLHVRRLAMAAGIETGGFRGQARMAALAGLALKAFEGWRQDESADMAATMAELDRLLERAERAEREGLSPDLLGLPGLTSLLGRLPGRRASGDQAPPPSPGQPAE